MFEIAALLLIVAMTPFAVRAVMEMPLVLAVPAALALAFLCLLFVKANTHQAERADILVLTKPAKS